VRQLLAGGGAMALVGGAWPALVALTPAASRPWMGGTADNSVWSLIFAYNGVGRLSGSAGGARGLADGGAAGFAATPMNAPGGTNAVFGGSVGPLRLLESSLGGQAGWLVGAALVGLVGLSLATGLRRGEERSRWVFAAGYSFLTVGVAFTAARGIFHPYYTSQLAPLTAALIGATAGRSLEGDRTGRILAAAAVAGGIASELVVLHHLPGPVDWAPALLVAGGIGAAGTALALRAGRRGLAGLAVVLGLLLAAPASWAFATLGHPTDGTFPAGGPAGAMPGGRPATIHSGARTIAWALDYARAHGGGTLAIASQSGAAPSIIASGADIAGLGGFSGQESRVTTGWVAGSVGSRQVRWVLGAGRRSPVPVPTPVRPGRVIVAVRQSCRRAAAIPLAVLYDCAGRAGALAAAG
jgi:hypothetical protein